VCDCLLRIVHLKLHGLLYIYARRDAIAGSNKLFKVLINGSHELFRVDDCVAFTLRGVTGELGRLLCSVSYSMGRIFNSQSGRICGQKELIFVHTHFAFWGKRCWVNTYAEIVNTYTHDFKQTFHVIASLCERQVARHLTFSHLNSQIF
jgi:hypothetical protein